MWNYDTLPGMLRHVVSSYHNSFAFNDRIDGNWQATSTETFAEMVRRLALGLYSLGVRPGTSIAILARPSTYWVAMDLAITSNGAITVPLFHNVSEDNFLYQIRNSESKILFVDSQEQWEIPQRHQGEFDLIITRGIHHDQHVTAEVIGFPLLMEKGDQVSGDNPGLFAEMSSKVQKDDLATIIYTSGSTGVPKGVELTHGNITSQMHSASARFPTDPSTGVAFSCLPLAHVFERMVMYFHVSSGLSVYFADDIRRVGKLFPELKPTITAMVPRLLEKIYSKMEASLRESSMGSRLIGKWAFDLAHSDQPGIWSDWQHRLAEKLVFSKLRDALGGRLEAVIMGGAPLAPDLCRFFLKLGVPIFQGYGLTESSPVIAANHPEHNKVGSVGHPFPNVEVKISPEGEVLARGPNIMRGYHKDPEATAKVLSKDGWLSTGDLGELDADGYLTITGRIKEIQKTSNGKMVSPIPIEQEICKDSLIDQAMVIADGRRFVSCLLFADQQELSQLKEPLGKRDLSDQQFAECPELHSQMEDLISEVNKGLNHWEQVRKYHLIASPLSVDTNELTPTLKMRRKAISENYSELIETMYRESGDTQR